jgi:hypothetical protein
MIFSYFLIEEVIKGKVILEEESTKIIEKFVKIFLNGVVL